MNKADQETVQVLAELIRRGREDGCDDHTLASIIFVLADNAYCKAIRDAMPTIIGNCQPKA
jgi:hypothetical protein